MDTTNYQQHFITMTEAGFIAVNQGDEDAAVKLFTAARLLAPTELLPQIGFGYLHLCKLELKKAAEIFSALLEKDPQNELARTFLGLSLALNPAETEKGEMLLSQASQATQDAQVQTLASGALQFVEKFVKKAPTPVQSHVAP